MHLPKHQPNKHPPLTFSYIPPSLDHPNLSGEQSPEIVTMSAPTENTPKAKPHRVLACVLCQQRKVKCDRTFPCSSCTKQGAQCVPATQPRPRRRRFPERELLERLRRYEALMKQNNVKFDPLHDDASTAKNSPQDYDSENENESQQGRSEGITEVK